MKGETRQILALIFGVCGIGVLSYLSLTGVSGALTALVATMSSVTAFYFGSKTGAEKPEA